jgi:hypothetical protein
MVILEYCDKLILPCKYCGYDCKFNRTVVTGKQFLQGTICNLNCSQGIPASVIRCDFGNWVADQTDFKIEESQLGNICGKNKKDVILLS